jgi:hypothetical protein
VTRCDLGATRVVDAGNEHVAKSLISSDFAEPSGGLEPPTPPYHLTAQATDGNSAQAIWLLFAHFPAARFAVDCHWLPLLGSINAPYPLGAVVLRVGNSAPEIAVLDEVH